MLQAVILGDITIAGLGIIDVTALAERLGVAVLVVTRHNPARSELADALKAAGLTDRLSLLERIPRAYGVGEGLYLAHAGVPRVEAERLLTAALEGPAAGAAPGSPPDRAGDCAEGVEGEGVGGRTGGRADRR